MAKDLIANDETEISEGGRRFFDDLGSERHKNVSKVYADWCFELLAAPEWTAVDSAVTEAGAREHLRRRYDSCFPFHPAVLSVFQRKWQALPSTSRPGTLAMLAQWISWLTGRVYRSPPRTLITLGSAPLRCRSFAV